jgi:hypothetical protein
MHLIRSSGWRQFRKSWSPSPKAGTWNVADRPTAGARVFPSKFVLKIKRNSDGTIERYKARLVLLGHLQRPNIDFFETYAPVVDITAVRIALVIAVQTGMSMHHLDVKCAFLNGYIEEEIYMRLPDGFNPSNDKVCKLNKSIYGLRQAPRAWHERLSDDLSKLGHVIFQHAESVFWRQCGESKVFLLIYVDDILILASAVDDIQNIKDEIPKLYEIKDLGEPEYFLGIKLERSSIDCTLKLSPTSYIHKILERFNMSQCKPVISPMVVNRNK